jgi:hypothetical protein
LVLTLIGFALALGAARTAAAQMRLCAGKPCPDTTEPPSEGGAPPPRVLVIDAVVLTPALEKLNARAGIQRTVVAGIQDKGWEPVVGSSACKDLVCAGAAAATEKTPYALVLTGRFVKDESYVDDVAVSLLRDGKVIATQTEAEDEQEFVRSGGARAEFPRCGPPSGICTTKLLGGKLRKYAEKLVANENVGIRIRKKVAETEAAKPVVPVAVPVAAAPAAVAPSPAPTPAPTTEAQDRRWLGWVLIGGGVAAGAASALAWSMDGNLTDCSSADPASCKRQRDTLIPTLAFGAVAVGALTAGGIVLYRGRTQGADVAVALQPTGLSIGGRY